MNPSYTMLFIHIYIYILIKQRSKKRVLQPRSWRSIVPPSWPPPDRPPGSRLNGKTGGFNGKISIVYVLIGKPSINLVYFPLPRLISEYRWIYNPIQLNIDISAIKATLLRHSHISHEATEAPWCAAQAFEPFLQGGALTFTGVVGIAEGGKKSGNGTVEKDGSGNSLRHKCCGLIFDYIYI